jgi:hypothetical protein
MGKSTNTIIIIIALLMLSGCGPTLFNVGGVLKVTTGDVAGSIVKKKILTAKPPKEQEK